MRRLTGVIFCAIAALLYATRYIAAALYTPANAGVWSSEQFARWMSYVGSDLWIWAGLALVVGVGYLIWAEVLEYRHRATDREP